MSFSKTTRSRPPLCRFRIPGWNALSPIHNWNWQKNVRDAAQSSFPPDEEWCAQLTVYDGYDPNKRAARTTSWFKTGGCLLDLIPIAFVPFLTWAYSDYEDWGLQVRVGIDCD
jgi:hypothetical protein